MKISELTTNPSPSSSDVVPVVSGGTTYKEAQSAASVGIIISQFHNLTSNPSPALTDVLAVDVNGSAYKMTPQQLLDASSSLATNSSPLATDTVIVHSGGVAKKETGAAFTLANLGLAYNANTSTYDFTVGSISPVVRATSLTVHFDYGSSFDPTFALDADKERMARGIQDGYFNAGSVARRTMLLNGFTDGTIASQMFTYGGMPSIPDGTIWLYTLRVIGREYHGELPGNEICVYTRYGMIDNVAGTISTMDLQADLGAMNWDFDNAGNVPPGYSWLGITVGCVGTTLRISIRGKASRKIAWVGRLELEEITFTA